MSNDDTGVWILTAGNMGEGETIINVYISKTSAIKEAEQWVVQHNSCKTDEKYMYKKDGDYWRRDRSYFSVRKYEVYE